MEFPGLPSSPKTRSFMGVFRGKFAQKEGLTHIDNYTIRSLYESKLQLLTVLLRCVQDCAWSRVSVQDDYF